MMVRAVRSTRWAAASESATRELVDSAISNPSAWVHGRDIASPPSCCYWPHGQGAPKGKAAQTAGSVVGHDEVEPQTARAIELQGLIDFDVQRTGFSLVEIHLVLDQACMGSATWDCNPELEGANRISQIDTV
jgi:hypothetical protein